VTLWAKMVTTSGHTFATSNSASVGCKTSTNCASADCRRRSFRLRGKCPTPLATAATCSRGTDYMTVLLPGINRRDTRLYITLTHDHSYIHLLPLWLCRQSRERHNVTLTTTLKPLPTFGRRSHWLPAPMTEKSSPSHLNLRCSDQPSSNCTAIKLADVSLLYHYFQRENCTARRNKGELLFLHDSPKINRWLLLGLGGWLMVAESLLCGMDWTWDEICRL